MSRPLLILDMMKNIAFFGYIINHVCHLSILVCKFVNAFWLMAQFCKTYGVALNWIYLEAGHGKGLPDCIGGNVKRVTKDLVAFTP